MSDRDPLYLFLCHLEWSNRGALSAYAELGAALSDSDLAIRALAEDLIVRCSQRAQSAAGQSVNILGLNRGR